MKRWRCVKPANRESEFNSQCAKDSKNIKPKNNRIPIVATLNGSAISSDDIIRSIIHELGHSGGLPHPWNGNSPEDVKQNEDGGNSPTKEKTIKENLMNSAENPNDKLKEEKGKETTPGQLERIDQTVKSQQPQ